MFNPANLNYVIVFGIQEVLVNICKMTVCDFNLCEFKGYLIYKASFRLA